ncbi:hypothetical protein BJX70DRAFT_353040 [Aspergillus crustosus]
MPLGRSAYRHATRYSPIPSTEHLWVSEDLLSSTFHRFVSNQRRYGSHVPGPLEARRRLDKRRNTALASVVGAGPMDDAACLLGLNGTEHLKQSNSGLWRRNTGPPPPPVPLYGENINKLEDSAVHAPTEKLEFYTPDPDETIRDQLTERSRDCRSTGELEEVVRELKIDLRQDSSYSRLLFECLCSKVDQLMVHPSELKAFLDNPHLNTTGSGNHLEAVMRYLCGSTESRDLRLGLASTPSAYVQDGIMRALELGRIYSGELKAIINALAKSESLYHRDHPKATRISRIYRDMWKHIGLCGVYGHKDMDKTLVETWLGALLERCQRTDMSLVLSILLGTANHVADKGVWVQRFISHWFGSNYVHSQVSIYRLAAFLKPFHPDLIATSVTCIQRALLSSGQLPLLAEFLKGLHPECFAASVHNVTRALLYSREPLQLARFFSQIQPDLVATTITNVTKSLMFSNEIHLLRKYLTTVQPDLAVMSITDVIRTLESSGELHMLAEFLGQVQLGLAQKSILDVTRALLTSVEPRSLATLLGHFYTKSCVNFLLRTTRALVASQELDLLKRWRQTLSSLMEADKLRVAYSLVSRQHMTKDLTSKSKELSMQQHVCRIIDGLWILHTMRADNYKREDYVREEDPLYQPTKVLYRFYDQVRDDPVKNIWDNLIEEIQDKRHEFILGMLAEDLMSEDPRTPEVSILTQRLRKYTSRRLNLSGVFKGRMLYDRIGRYGFFQQIAEMIQDLDFTSPEFIQKALHIARTGDAYEVRDLCRLLRSNISFNIALAFSRPPSEPIDRSSIRQSLFHYNLPLRTTKSPDPYTAMETIHSVVIAVACSEHLTSRVAFQYTQWFYRLLSHHSAPLGPPLARAIYHAGVVRMRKEGRVVGLDQYQYIMSLMAYMEEPHVVEALKRENWSLEKAIFRSQKRQAMFDMFVDDEDPEEMCLATTILSDQQKGVIQEAMQEPTSQKDPEFDRFMDEILEDDERS